MARERIDGKMRLSFLKRRSGQTAPRDLSAEAIAYIQNLIQQGLAPEGEGIESVFDYTKKLWSVAHQNQTGTANGISVNYQSTGGPASADATDIYGTAERIRTTDSSGGWTALHSGAPGNFTRIEHEQKAFFRVAFYDTNLVRYWIGLFSGAPEGSDTPSLHYVALRLTRNDVAQVVEFTIDESTDGVYGVTINGAEYTYEAASNTKTEIRDAIIDLINGSEAGAAVLAEPIDDDDDDKFTVTALVAGVEFTHDVIGDVSENETQANVTADSTLKIVVDNGTGTPNEVDTEIEPPETPVGILFEIEERGTLLRWTILSQGYAVLGTGEITEQLPDAGEYLDMRQSVTTLENAEKGLILYHSKGRIG